MPFDRVVPHIDQVRADFLVTKFRCAAEMMLQQRTGMMAYTVMAQCKNRIALPDKSDQVVPPLGYDRGVNMVRHLTKRQNPDPVFLRRGAEDSKVHQKVALAVEKDSPFLRPLVTMIQNAFDHDPLSAFHSSKVYKTTAISECPAEYPNDRVPQ